MNAPEGTQTTMVERLAKRCVEEAGVLSIGQWAEGTRWWMRAIAEELEAAHSSFAGNSTRWYLDRAAEWLRFEADRK